MILKLCWEDKNNKIYFLGELTFADGKYYFKLNEDEMEKAIQNGCIGIGSLDLTKIYHVSDKLFTFFKIRIPSEDNINIKEILNKYKIEKYDEMELLKATGGILYTDRYFLT